MLNQETAKAARTDSGYILRAPRRMRVADAVAQYMRVPMGAGNSVPWDPLVAPYVIEPMNCLASREYDAVIFVGPARTGKTIGLIDGWVIYNVICDPADMLIIQMTEEKAREHSKKRLARTFRVSPEVVSRLSPNKNDNNVYDRTFLAGNYLKIGWPSVNIMSSSDYKCVALTDYDRFPEDIDGEGDAFSLASKRTTTFMSSGMTLVESSPGRDVKDVKWRRTSPHEAPPTTGILSLYNRGDRRRWYWPCPHCGEYFQPCGDVVAGFRDIADPVLASEAAYIQCPSCSGRILPEQKRELNGRGVWLRDGESINADGSRYGDPRRSRIASFWMEGPAAAYQTLSQLVYKLLTAEQEYETTGSEETLKTVINTDWGLPYLPRASMEQRKSELLEQRAEPVPSRSVPDGVNFLVATVDVQAGRHRRFVVQVTGYGSRGERWIIDRYNITQSLRGDSDGESQRIDPASYSAQRQELVESTDGYLILQDWFIGAVTRPMYRAWLKQAVASGVIRLPRDLDRSSLYTAVYSGPVMPWIDPVKEAEAWKIQIRGGAATESDWVRAGGRNPDDVKRRRKAEIDENRKLDLVFDTDPASDKGGSSAATKRQEPQHTDDQSEE